MKDAGLCRVCGAGMLAEHASSAGQRLILQRTELQSRLAQIRVLAEAAKASVPNAPYTGLSWQRVFEILESPGGVR